MSSYAPIRVSTLRGDQKIPFNAYVKVAGKHILLCREGDSFEGPRLERLRGKKITQLFVQEDQKAAYETYIRVNLDMAYDSAKNKPIDIRTQIVHGSLQAAAEDLMAEPEAKDYYSVAIDAVRRFSKFFFAEPEAMRCILAMKNADFSVAYHGVNVAVLSLAICETLGLLEKATDVEAMLVGAMIHDIEHNHNNLSRSTKPELYLRTEKRIFNTHATDGWERIKGFTHFDPIVRDIVLYHEEKIDGSGPHKKRDDDLDPITQVVIAANVFDSYLTYDDIDLREALKKYLIERMGAVQLEAMKALQTAMKKRDII